MVVFFPPAKLQNACQKLIAAHDFTAAEGIGKMNGK
jgi:hypothetical protein